MNDNENKKNSSGIKHNKIKAIYPHIEASIVYEKPYYMICWYDIESKAMNYGYGSFNIEYVSEWLKEYFEAVESDFVNLINCLEAENERLKRKNDELAEVLSDTICIRHVEVKTKAYKEFAELLHCHCESIINQPHNEICHPLSWKVAYEEFEEKVNNLLKEMVGGNSEKV